jgi:hypothetical protein
LSNIVSFGRPSPLMLEIVQGWLFVWALKTVDWAFAKKTTLRRYDPLVEGQHATPIGRPLSIHKRSPRRSRSHIQSARNRLVMVIQVVLKPRSWSTSISTVLSKLLLNFLAYNVSHYLSSVDPTLSFDPRCVWAGFHTVCVITP